MTLNEIQEEIIEEFSYLEGNRDDIYTYIIETGKKLSGLDPADCTEENLIKGCQSKVWVRADFENGKIQFRADSDAVLVKGIIALLVRVLSGREPAEVMEADLYFIDKIGLPGLLSMNRSNGLNSMIKQLKIYALAYDTHSRN